MQNQIYSHLFNQSNLRHQQIDDMDDHLDNLLNATQSRYTAAETMVSSTINNNTQQTFHSSRIFAISTLQSWGMKIGTLQYTKDNEITLKCILQLINQRQREIQNKLKLKDQISLINFEKQKYQSLLKQSKNSLSQKDKQLGKIQNQLTQLRKKLKGLESQYKKEKLDDSKIINMLKSKNQQILHQIKKKQVQVTRFKQQMKKTVTSKSITTNLNQSKQQGPLSGNQNNVKNSFQIIQKIERNNSMKQSKWKNNKTQRVNINEYYNENLEQQKWNFMVQKYQKEKKNFVNQNHLLRNKIFQVRELLVGFAQWLQVQLFGQTLQSTKKFLEKKFICNHNIMLSKNVLIQDLDQIIKQAKDGIQQFQQRLIKTQSSIPSSKSIQSPLKSNKKVGFTNVSQKSIKPQTNTMFKKKSVSIRESGTPGKLAIGNSKSQKNINSGGKQSQKQIKIKEKQKIIDQPKKSLNGPAIKSPQIQKTIFNQSQYISQSMPSQIRPSKQSYINELQLSAFENDLLSDIHQHENDEPDNSIISHISASDLLKQVENGKKGKYDKWDILFHTDGDEQQ